MDEIHQKMKNKDRAKIIRGMYSPQEILGVVGQMDMMIGMRLHSLIFAARMNVPVVGLSYDTKTSEFLRMIGQDRWSCDYKNININNVFQNIYHVWINRDDIKRDLDVKVNELQIKSRYNAELARELLER
jgi:polysaccharide pyruvyl transferase WcaK-like protein